MPTLLKHLCRTAAIGVLGGAVSLTPARAQSGIGSQVELGAYGSFTKYDDGSLGLDSKFGAGGRLSFFFNRTFSLEASGDFTNSEFQTTGVAVNVTRLAGTLFAHTRPVGINVLYLGAGYERLFYSGAVEDEDNGAHLVLGDRISLGGRTSLRLEVRGAFYPSSPFQAPDDQVINFSGSVGISVYAFGGPSRDSDGDKVANNIDQCPDTPRGAEVDPNGCPLDEDSDAVFNGIDQCPQTPSGAFVDDVGCPEDADSDGVPDGIDVCPNTPVGAAVDENGCPQDADGDTVVDGLDRCPDTPQGATVDSDGCPLDGDQDGVFDGIDQCPETPSGTPVDETGCPADSDGDGVTNAVDQCPDTPPNTVVDATGCPPAMDSDNDGVADGIDRCPNTAPGQEVDEVGCPVLFVIEEGVARPLILRGVNFEVGRSRLTTDSYIILDAVSGSLLAHPEVRIEIAGHTDSTGPRSLNMRLSRARAQSVMAYLARQGVDPSRMIATGYGPDQPIATNTTVAGRAQNRRVELHRMDQQ